MSSPLETGSSLLKAGDYVLDLLEIRSVVSGNSVDLRGLISKFEIYEDLFSPYLSAKVYIRDSFNFPERLPIRGKYNFQTRYSLFVSGESNIQSL
jgi:hypothetical protein